MWFGTFQRYEAVSSKEDFEQLSLRMIVGRAVMGRQTNKPRGINDLSIPPFGAFAHYGAAPARSALVKRRWAKVDL